MGRAPCCDKNSVKKGPWSPEEDAKLKAYIDKYGTGGNWIALPHKVGLRRCGKSCRLRWLNYLRPNIKHGGFTDEEDRVICSLYIAIGSRWSIIAAQLPGRTDNDIKNYWNTKLKKKLFGKHNCIDQQTARRLVAAKQEQMTCHALQRLIAQSHRSSSTTTTTTRKSTTATDTIHNYPQPIIQNNSQQPHDHSQTQQQPNQSFNYQHHNMNITNLCSNPTMMEQFAAVNGCSKEPAAFPMHQEEDLSAIIRTQNQSVISYAGGPSSNSTSAAMAGGHGSPEFAPFIHRDDSQVLSSGSTSSEGNYESAWKCSIDAESLGAYAIPNIDTTNDLLMFASTSTSSDYSNYDQHSNVEFGHRIAGKNYETASMGVIDSASFYSSLYK